MPRGIPKKRNSKMFPNVNMELSQPRKLTKRERDLRIAEQEGYERGSCATREAMEREQKQNPTNEVEMLSLIARSASDLMGQIAVCLNKAYDRRRS